MRPWKWHGLALLLSGAFASAEDADDEYRTLADYHHTAWTVEQGAPGDTWAIAQTTDGWLWLGGPRGLFRFDGIQFEHIELEGRGRDQSPAIYTLLAEDSGDLWIGYTNGGASRLRHGVFRHFDEKDGMSKGTVASFARDGDGVLWAAGTTLLKLDGEHWQEALWQAGVVERPRTLHVDQQGTLWVATDNRIYHLPRGASLVSPTAITFAESAGFLQSPDGRSWYEDETGAYLLPGQLARTPRSPQTNSREPYGGLLDQDGHFWALRDGSVSRYRVPEGSERVSITDGANADRFTRKDGLPAIAHSIIEDREGNLWTATSAGLDRFRPTNVRRLSFRGEVTNAHALAAADGGGVWIGLYFSGSETSRSDGLWKFDGQLTRVVPDAIKQVSALERDANGTLWVGGAQGVWRLENETRMRKLPELPAPAHGQHIHVLAVDGAGVPWAASALRSPLYRFQDNAWQRFGNPSEDAPERPNCHARDRLGRLWFGYRDGTLTVLQADQAMKFDARHGLDVGMIEAISVGRQTIVAGPRHIAVLHAGRFHLLAALDDPARLHGITGIVETSDGDVWLNGARGLVRIGGREIERARSSGLFGISTEVFDTQDGYPGMAQGVRPRPTLIQGTNGRLWFAGTLGVGWLHPQHLYRNGIPPPVHIRSLSAGDHTYRPTATSLLPKGTHDLHIDYTALSLGRPDSVRFKYRLDGYDETWVDAGPRRQAFYTNLAPGNYRFQVIAANEHGLWNDAGASLSVVVPPTFTQTRSFVALCILAVLTLAWAAYSLRIRQVTARERSKLEERLRERERIARELHDTLLQGVQGLILRFQTVANQIGTHEQAQVTMERALERANALLIEGRDRVKNLRGATDAPTGLRQALLDAAEQMAADHSARLRVIENGTAPELHPIVREEAARIAIEAMSNAFRHAAATRIDVELFYERRCLRIIVRDDGRGIESSVALAGREGHFGFVGMRERAKRIRGRLTIWSRPGAGTEVSLVVPARMVYARANRRRSEARVI